LIFGDVNPHQVDDLDKLVAQVVVAGFGEVAILSLEIIRASVRPPEASNLGDSDFGVLGIVRPVALTALVPFERL
jgi:hypothetical protein